MKKTFTILFLSILLGHSTPVLFPLDAMFGGAPYTQTFTLQAAQTFVTDGTNAWIGGNFTVTPGGGTNPIVSLTPNTYLVVFPDATYPWRIKVPNTTNQLNALNLATGPLPTFLLTANGAASTVNNATGTNVNLGGNFTGNFTAAGPGNISIIGSGAFYGNGGGLTNLSRNGFDAATRLAVITNYESSPVTFAGALNVFDTASFYGSFAVHNSDIDMSGHSLDEADHLNANALTLAGDGDSLPELTADGNALQISSFGSLLEIEGNGTGHLRVYPLTGSVDYETSAGGNFIGNAAGLTNLAAAQLTISATNYNSANFSPPPAGQVKFAVSNNWMFTITRQSTNPAFKIGP